MGFTNVYADIIIIFLVTALWDIILRLMSEGHIKFFGVEKMKWVVVLEEYFREHTVLSASLIAGFVGAITYPIILASMHFLNIKGLNLSTILTTIIISAAVGIPMRYLEIFPHLKKHYYEPLGFVYSSATDAFSGLVVGATFQTIKFLI